MISMHKVAIAAALAKDIEMLRECSAIATIHRDILPESYTFIEDIIVAGYRVSIYNMNLVGKSYMIDIKYLGKYQVM